MSDILSHQSKPNKAGQGDMESKTLLTFLSCYFFAERINCHFDCICLCLSYLTS